MASTSEKLSRYRAIIEKVYFQNYTTGANEVHWVREQLVQAATELEVLVPKNLGDVVYTFRFREELPDSIKSTAQPGMSWVIRLAGKARYAFTQTDQPFILPNTLLERIPILDSTPGMIARYAVTDEQALLAQLRYNRLLDVFTGVTCYSLQNHLRTQVTDIGQTETDEIYLGVDKHGSRFVFPAQAKGGRDKLSIVQIEQDLAMCREKFPDLICQAIAAQFVPGNVIALFSFRWTNELRVAQIDEKHYSLVAHDQPDTATSLAKS